MKLFDSHCHLDDRAFDGDIDAVIQRMKAAGVAAAMIAGTGQNNKMQASPQPVDAGYNNNAKPDGCG